MQTKIKPPKNIVVYKVFSAPGKHLEKQKAALEALIRMPMKNGETKPAS